MTDTYPSAVIDESVLRSIKERTFFYPCAGSDWVEPLAVFGNWFDNFIFADINYQFEKIEPIASQDWLLLSEYNKLNGPAHDDIHQVNLGRSKFREVEPAWLHERYQNTHSDRVINVIRRRGFGQYALNEIPDASLGVFCHRGDSPGEGGSGTCFLGNTRANHPPLANLFDKVKCKLAYPALVVSDGSNTSVPQLIEAAHGATERTDSVEFVHFGLHWRRVGQMEHLRDRLSVIWQVSPTENSL